MKKIFIFITFIFVFAIVSASNVFAEFPERNIRLIVPFAAGGGGDVGCRFVAEAANKYLENATIIVENMVGAGGLRGQSYVAFSEPDGYTLLGYSGSVMKNPHTKQGCPYVTDDFQPLAMYVYDPEFLIVPKDSPFENFDQFIEAAKSEKGIILNTSGISTGPHVMALMVANKVPGANFKYIHADSGSEQVQQLLGGHVDGGFMSAGEAYGQLEAGAFKAIVYSDSRRHDIFSDVPTLQEKGIDVIYGAVRGIAGPADLPDEIVKFYDDLFNKAINSDGFKEKMGNAGYPVTYRNAEDFTIFTKSYEENFLQILEELNS